MPSEKKSKKDLNYQLIFSALAALNIIGVLLYGILFYSIGVKEKNVAALIISLESETKKAAGLKSLTNVIQTTEEKRKKLDSYFLHFGDIVPFIEGVESLGKDIGVVVNFESVNVSERNGNAYLAVDLKTEGSLSSTVRFLSLLELLPRSVSFEKVFMEQKSAGEKTTFWAGSFVVNVLSFTKEK